jgi:hypothetical protein
LANNSKTFPPFKDAATMRHCPLKYGTCNSKFLSFGLFGRVKASWEEVPMCNTKKFEFD